MRGRRIAVTVVGAASSRISCSPRPSRAVLRGKAKYLFWFHHHGAHKNAYRGKNPVWLSGGIEQGGFIYWSQPEIVLYDLAPENCRFDPTTGIPGEGGGMSYPDLIEQDGRYWITETQKTVARVHPIDATLLDDLWNQDEAKTVAKCTGFTSSCAFM